MNGMTQAKMRTEDRRPTRAEKLRNAERTRDELNSVLRALGIALPSLGVEPMAYGDENPEPLLDLGRCNHPTARRLLAVLRDRADTGEAGPVSGAGEETDAK